MLGIAFALSAAGLWGLGDFSGGMGVRRGQPFGVLLVSAASGIVLLSGCFLFIPEPWPDGRTLCWALAAGGSGALGLTALYTGLARGRAAVVAPTTAVVGAIIPVLFTFLTAGAATGSQLAGMTVALAGLWLVSAAVDGAGAKGGFGFGFMAGVGVSGFLICMAFVTHGSLLWPLLLARVAGVLVATISLLALGGQFPRSNANPWALLAGAMDAGGNALYVLSIQHIRLDLAAVLSSLYPAITVLLAMRFLHQKVVGRQWLGVALCLAGVALISW